MRGPCKKCDGFVVYLCRYGGFESEHVVVIYNNYVCYNNNYHSLFLYIVQTYLKLFVSSKKIIQIIIMIFYSYNKLLSTHTPMIVKFIDSIWPMILFFIVYSSTDMKQTKNEPFSWLYDGI